MKRKLSTGVLIAVIGLASSSCKKEKSQADVPQNSSAASDLQFKTNGKFLIFETPDAYKKIAESPENEIRTRFVEMVKKMDHISLAEKLTQSQNQLESVPNDPYFAQILNEDKAVQIGNYLYHINKENTKVYVLDAHYTSEYKDLVSEQTSNAHIREFSTNDEVLEIVENGTNLNKTVLCSEDGAGARNETKGFQMANGGFFTMTSSYIKGGIYFSVNMTAQSNFSLGSRYRMYIEYENLWYHVKCGSTNGPSSNPWWSASQNGFSQQYVPYSSIHALNGYHIKSRARVEDSYFPSGSNPYTIYFTNWARVQINNPYFP